MADQHFSPEESLRVIRTMIEKVKEDVSDNPFFLLLWGWLVFIAAVSQYILLVIVKWPYHYLSWNLMLVGAIISIVYGIKSEKRHKPKTYITETMKYFGIGCGVTFVLLALFFGYNNMWQTVFPVYFIFYGFLSFVSGAILQFIPLRWAGVACWLIAIVAVYVDFKTHLLLMALVVLLAYIIPGYILQKRYKITQYDSK